MKKHVLPILLIAAAAIMWIVFYNELPSEMPIHWNMAGEADGFASKLNAMLLSVGLLVFLYITMIFVPRIDPKSDNYRLFSRGYTIIQLSIMLLIFVVNMLVIFSGLDHHLETGDIVVTLVGVMFIVIGNYMPQVKPNYFVGIKTPWALNNEENWRKTHRMGGKTFIIAGLLFILSVFLPSGNETYIFPLILLIALFPMGYSYSLFRKQEKK
jgi:uncharacterized membrane protein